MLDHKKVFCQQQNAYILSADGAVSDLCFYQYIYIYVISKDANS